MGVVIPNRINCTKWQGGRDSEQLKMHKKGMGVAIPEQNKIQKKGMGVAIPNRINCKEWHEDRNSELKIQKKS